jgi:cytochrome c-type biogenesis protein CcsB
MITSSQLFGTATLVYLLAAVCYIGLLVFQHKKVGKVGFWIAVLGVLFNTAALALRWVESYQLGIGRAPLTNMYESLVFFAWCTALFYVLLEWKFKTPIVGSFVMPLPFIIMAYATLAPRVQGGHEITPLIPALQSNWLIIHVVTCFIGYGAFAVAACLGIMYLLKSVAQQPQQQESQNAIFPKLQVLDDLIHKTIIFGFMWLTAGILSGAVWANEAWGTYWSWDPKETWSLITWFLYAFALHARFTRGWAGKRIAWLAIIGMFSVFITYFGVNYWLSGLHSYGS